MQKVPIGVQLNSKDLCETFAAGPRDFQRFWRDKASRWLPYHGFQVLTTQLCIFYQRKVVVDIWYKV